MIFLSTFLPYLALFSSLLVYFTIANDDLDPLVAQNRIVEPPVSIFANTQGIVSNSMQKLKAKRKANPSQRITMCKTLSCGAVVKVTIPRGDQVLKKSSKKPPIGYFSAEQVVGRKANRFLKSGKAKDDEEAIKMAKEVFEKIDAVKRESDKKRKRNGSSAHRKKLYNSRKEWTFRRATTLLATPGNGIQKHEEAIKKADELWNLRIQRQRESSQSKKTKEHE